MEGAAAVDGALFRGNLFFFACASLKTARGQNVAASRGLECCNAVEEACPIMMFADCMGSNHQ